MKTTLRLLISLMFAFATFIPNSSVSAIEMFKFRGDSVSAFFTNTDGCIETSVFVAATEGVIQRPPGPGSPVTEVALLIFRFDVCSETRLVSAEAVTSVPESRLVKKAVTVSPRNLNISSAETLEFCINVAHANIRLMRSLTVVFIGFLLFRCKMVSNTVNW